MHRIRTGLESASTELSDAGPLLVTASEVAQLLHVSTRTLWRLRSAGTLPSPVRLGGAVRWLLTDIETWIANGCSDCNSCDNTTRRK